MTGLVLLITSLIVGCVLFWVSAESCPLRGERWFRVYNALGISGFLLAIGSVIAAYVLAAIHLLKH